MTAALPEVCVYTHMNVKSVLLILFGLKYPKLNPTKSGIAIFINVFLIQNPVANQPTYSDTVIFKKQKREFLPCIFVEKTRESESE